MYIWVFEFIQAFFSYVVIVGVCTWYFSSNTDTNGQLNLEKGVVYGLKYNSGSLAMGSFLLMMVWIIRSLLEHVDKKLKQMLDSESPIVSITHQCL